MALHVVDWVLKHSTSKGSQRLVLLAIADVADDSGANARATKAELAAIAAIDPSTVRRSIRKLEALGELKVSRLGNGHNVYRVIMEPENRSSPDSDESRIPTQRPAPPTEGSGSSQEPVPKKDSTNTSTVRFHLPPGITFSMDVTPATDDQD